ncbi:MAG: DUF6788 family protein, partial [Candidatus Acidiferrales bacterium]
MPVAIAAARMIRNRIRRFFMVVHFHSTPDLPSRQRHWFRSGLPVSDFHLQRSPWRPRQFRALARLLPLIRDSLVEQYVTCGKPCCRCRRGQVKHRSLIHLLSVKS